MENMNLWCVKACWGNYTFDYAHSDSVGNSGGILCIWDPNSFQKDNVTVSDFFIIIRGTWLKSGVKILMVAVYAPRLERQKILGIIWSMIINRWDCADMFNMFIANAGLEEIPLGGSSFTWCHKSATKMSKLDKQDLGNRLVGVLGDIVNEVQSAFISDRQILDGPFILNEVIQWCKSKKKQSLIFKVDFEKAYDSVRWDFLDDVLKKFGFGIQWCCDGIQSVLRSSEVVPHHKSESYEEFPIIQRA
ncbi:RNA-directed DNA polymerase, eukaryota [Tanacetum coccineum]